MSAKKFVLRPGVQLVEYDHPDALFSYYGNPHFHKLIGPSFPLQDFLSFTSVPRELKMVQAKFSKSPDFDENFQLLRNEDFFVEVSPDSGGNRPIDSFVHFCSHFHHSIESSDEVLSELKEKHISVVSHLGLQDLTINAFSQLRLQNVRTLESHTQLEGQRADLVVVLSDWQHLNELLLLNKWCLEKNVEYLLVMFDMFGGSIGPTLGKLHGPCMSCLKARRNCNLDESRRSMVEKLEKWATENPIGIETGVFEPFAGTLLRLTAIECFKKLAHVGDAHGLFGLKEIDLLNIRTEYHEILPTPNCRMCFPKKNLGI